MNAATNPAPVNNWHTRQASKRAELVKVLDSLPALRAEAGCAVRTASVVLAAAVNADDEFMIVGTELARAHAHLESVPRNGRAGGILATSTTPADANPATTLSTALDALDALEGAFIRAKRIANFDLAPEVIGDLRDRLENEAAAAPALLADAIGRSHVGNLDMTLRQLGDRLTAAIEDELRKRQAAALKQRGMQ